MSQRARVAGKGEGAWDQNRRETNENRRGREEGKEVLQESGTGRNHKGRTMK